MTESAGARIGRYEIERTLGLGGMGKVLLARDTVLGRLVALKLVREDLGLPPDARQELFRRMRHEARAAAALSHPNIVIIHDMGEEPAPLGLYLVFEYIEGPTLRDRLDGGALPAPMVARLARQLGDALATAHAAGVIHRDVKPENVLLAAAGAKIADFGVARLPSSTLTQAGVVLGTPEYSAPEALTASEFSPASDQFSFAATLFEALTGARAFPGDDAVTVAARIATEEPGTVPTSAWYDARGANAVLMRALSKDPAKRFSSCREFGEALAAALERAPSLPPPPPSVDVPPPPPSVTRTSISPVPRSTQRAQNVAAGTAMLVLIALVVIGGGRRTVEPLPEAEDGATPKPASTAFASVVAPAHPASPHRVEPHPLGHAAHSAADAGSGAANDSDSSAGSASATTPDGG